MTLVTRLAPTPSGFLHVGNVVNLLLTAWLARISAGRLVLRIDDFDIGRARPEYIQDIFSTLEWLGIEADEGPRDADEFRADWSMSARTDRFRAALTTLRDSHPTRVFVCRCSRRELSASSRCVAGCPDATHALLPGDSVVRLRVDEQQTVSVAGQIRGVPPADHVLWRRDDLPSYQLGSLVTDIDLGVNAVVRGEDLRDSSALQVHLASLLGRDSFATADFRHHRLLTAPDGQKLSKSAGAQARPLTRDAALRDQVAAWAQRLGAEVGIGQPGTGPVIDAPRA